MSYNTFAVTDRMVAADGLGNIFTCNADGSDPQNFPYAGCDPVWAWGGAAILFVSADRHRVWCANVDGSGLYNTGIYAQELSSPYLDPTTGVYFVCSLDGANGNQLYKYGAGGYAITLMATGLDHGFAVNYNGTWLMASGFLSGRCELLGIYVDLSQYWWTIRDDVAVNPDARHPALSPDGWWIAYQCGHLAGVNPYNAATYHAHDIGVLQAGTNTTFTIGAGATEGSGNYVDTPNWSTDNSVVTYDFSGHGNSGIWALEAFEKGGVPRVGGGVWGNPHGEYAQLGSLGSKRLKHR